MPPDSWETTSVTISLTNLELVVVVFALKIWLHDLYGIYWEIYIDHHSLQYIMSQRDLNSRQRRRIKLLAYYDLYILYHPSKANIIADTLSRKVISMGNLAFFPNVVWPLASNI